MKSLPNRERPSSRALCTAAVLPAAFVALTSLVLACSAQDEPLQDVRAEVGRAMAEGDQAAVHEALARLRESEPPTPEAVQEAANLMIRAGEAPQALRLLEDGLERFPERHDLRLLFARVALMRGEASRAVGTLEEIDAESLFHPDALVLRARATRELGDLEGALAILDEAERLYPALTAVRQVRIQVLFQDRRFDEVVEQVEEAKAQAPSDAELHELLILEARARGARGETEEAVAILLEVVKQDPDGFDSWTLLVQALSGLNRREEAVALIESALAESPQRARLYPILADLHVRADQRDAAEDVLRRFVEVSKSPSAYLELADFHRAAGDTEQALAVVNEALAVSPSEPMLQSTRVEILLGLERLDDAHAALAEMQSAESVDASPDLAYLRARLALIEGDAEGAAGALREIVPKLDRLDAHLYLGQALEELGDLEGAERAYTAARQSPSTAPEASLSLLRIAETRGDAVGRREAARQLLRFPEHRTRGLHGLVAALLELDNAERAEKIAKRLLEEEPETLDAHLLLARALQRQGRTVEAEQVLAEAEARLTPGLEITAEQAVLLAAVGRTGDAIAALEQALEERREDTELMQRLAALYFEKGEFEPGSALIDQALEADPGNLQPLRLRIVYTAVNGPLDIARGDAERYLEAHPRDHEIHFRLASVYAELGLTEQAVAAYRRSAELAPGAVAPRNNLAVLLQQSGDLDAALELAREAYERAKDDPDVLDTLGWIYVEQGLLDRAIPALEEAHVGSPGGLGTLHLALAYGKAGRAEEAQQLLSALVARADLPTDLRSQAEDALRTLVP